MKACYICRWFQFQIEEEPACARFRVDPLPDLVTRSTASLGRLKCYQGSGGLGGSLPTFSRIKISVVVEKVEYLIYCCCPAQWDAFVDRTFKAWPLSGRSKGIEYRWSDTVIRHCPFCGWKLQMASEMDEKHSKIAKKRLELSKKRRAKQASAQEALEAD